MHSPEHQPAKPHGRPAPANARSGQEPTPRSSGAARTGTRTPTPLIAGGIAAGALLLAAAVSVGLFDRADTVPQVSGDGRGSPAPKGHSLLTEVRPEQTERAIATLMMTETEKADVRRAIEKGSARLGWITVSDIRAEDGDWVRIAGGPFVQDVRLLHKPYTVAVPYLPGVPISVTGMVDGGGGDITVAVYLGSSQISLKPLKKGETLHLPSP